MSVPSAEVTVHAQTLLGREVRDASGRALGRVYDLEVEGEDGELCVTALLLGARVWLTRFGWTEHEHGTRIPWDEVERLTPHITVRTGRRR